MSKSHDLSRWLVVIPARLASTRLPEKPLQLLGGKPLIARVYENAKPLEQFGAKIFVATDSKKIAQACAVFGLPYEMTGIHHESGTDRTFEVANRHPRDFVMNLQGDEPFLALEDLCSLCASLQSASHAQMATLAYDNHEAADFQIPTWLKL